MKEIQKKISDMFKFIVSKLPKWDIKFLIPLVIIVPFIIYSFAMRADSKVKSDIIRRIRKRQNRGLRAR